MRSMYDMRAIGPLVHVVGAVYHFADSDNKQILRAASGPTYTDKCLPV